jgi:hypothetical protein
VVGVTSPTREQVRKALADTWTDWNEYDPDVMADAVMALLSEPAPPTDDDPVLDENGLALALADVRQNGSGVSSRAVWDSHEALRTERGKVEGLETELARMGAAREKLRQRLSERIGYLEGQLQEALHPGERRVWVDGAEVDFLRIFREWRGYQQASIRRWGREVAAENEPHPDGLRCPRCGSTDVVCHGRPHGHECSSCGHDGTETTDA